MPVSAAMPGNLKHILLVSILLHPTFWGYWLDPGLLGRLSAALLHLRPPLLPACPDWACTNLLAPAFFEAIPKCCQWPRLRAGQGFELLADPLLAPLPGCSLVAPAS